ncbi:MAG: type III pantothenate kinase [Flavobacteriales bacterium]
MIKLTIDQGNSRTKLAVFENDTIIQKEMDASYSLVKTLINQSNLSILSTVKSKSKYYDLLREDDIFLNSATSLPITIKYHTPNTLGNDRVALAVGGVHNFPETDLLIIDLGSCITYDFIHSNHEFVGGGISPGLKMRYKALNQYTDCLPLLNPDLDKLTLTGKDTIESIHSGVINGMATEIDGIINRYVIKYPNLKTILTGGDLNFFDKVLKSSIFASPDLLMIGLNTILDYNENNS